MKLLLISLMLIGTLSGCEAKDKYFWTNSKTFPPLETKEGELVDIKIIRYVGQYNSFGDIMQKYKGPIEGPIVVTWKVTRLKGGKPDFKKLCGGEIKFSGYYDKTPRERESWNNMYDEQQACYEKHRAQAKTKEITHYYYARTAKSHEVVYPEKAKGHSHWIFTLYGGRVGDLIPHALTEEQKKNIHTLRAHPCYKYKKYYGVPNKACYDLPGEDKNLYYTIQELKYKQKDNGNYTGQWAYYGDVRNSDPTPWTEVKGIEIDKAMYQHLEKECSFGEQFCHLENYKGSMAKEQQSYVKSVSWAK